MYSKTMPTYVHTKPCTLSLAEALFVTSLNWKQPKCSSIGKWLKNYGTSISTMEYFSTVKMNELLIHIIIKMELKAIVLNEKSQSQKIIYFMILFITAILKITKLKG
jgi:hypothetical protein